MAKRTTVADLEARVKALEESLDHQRCWALKVQDKIKGLEQYQDKAKKQFWYLQRVAKGVFKPKTEAA